MEKIYDYLEAVKCISGIHDHKHPEIPEPIPTGYSLLYTTKENTMYDINEMYNLFFQGMQITLLNPVINNTYKDNQGTLYFQNPITSLGCQDETSLSVYPLLLSYMIDLQFQNVSKLTSLTLPEGLTSLYTYSVWSIDLETLEIPSTVTYIGTMALVFLKITTPRTKGINTLIMHSVTPPTLESAASISMDPTGEEITSVIKVPAEAVDAYKSAPIWSTFANIIEAI